MANFFKEIFLSKRDKLVVEVYNSISSYWKNTNNMQIAHVRYLQDLDYKYKLNMEESVIIAIPQTILIKLISKNLRQSNTMFIFSQFVVDYILRGGDSTKSRWSDKSLVLLAENIESLIIPYKSAVTPEFSFELDRNVDVRPFIEKESMENRRIADRKRSYQILASRIECDPDNLKEVTFAKFDEMGISMDMLESSIKEGLGVKLQHAKEFNMHPDDTPAALTIELMEEYRNVLLENYFNKGDGKSIGKNDLTDIDPYLSDEYF